MPNAPASKIILAKGLRVKGTKRLRRGGRFPGLSRDCPLIFLGIVQGTPFRLLIPSYKYSFSLWAFTGTIFSPERRWLHLHVLFWVFPNRPFILGTLPISSGNRACISFAWDLPDIQIFCLAKTQPRSKPAGQKIKKKTKKQKNKKETKKRKTGTRNQFKDLLSTDSYHSSDSKSEKNPPCHTWIGSISLLHISSQRTNRSTSWYLS